MCSRFEFNSNPNKLLKKFGFESIPIGFTTGEIRPTNPALVITKNKARTMYWGLSVNWSRKPLITARYETLENKPTFRPLIRNRCLIPASAYFEWRQDGRERLKNRIESTNSETLTFAGIHTNKNFIIITCQPTHAISHIHNRMPILIAPNERGNWINGSLGLEYLITTLNSPTFCNLRATEEHPLANQHDLFLN